LLEHCDFPISVGGDRNKPLTLIRGLMQLDGVDEPCDQFGREASKLGALLERTGIPLSDLLCFSQELKDVAERFPARGPSRQVQANHNPGEQAARPADP
jgi:hypothetical protein